MCAGKNKEEVEDVAPLPDGREWTTTTDDMSGLALKNMVLGSLYQVYANRSAGPAQVMVEQEEGEAICMIEIKPGGLMIFPYVKELQQIDGGV